jgi:hypothetical protein
MTENKNHFTDAFEQATGRTVDWEKKELQLFPPKVDADSIPSIKTPQTHLVIAGTLKPNVGQDKKRLYAANDAFEGLYPKASLRMRVEDAQRMVGDVIRHYKFDNIPHIDTLRRIYTPSEMVTERGTGWSGGTIGETNLRTGQINLRGHGHGGLGGVTSSTVTHEVAHLLTTPWLYGVNSNALGGEVKTSIDHDWGMAKLHVMATEAALGSTAADALRKAYRRGGVDFGEDGEEVDPLDHIVKKKR